MQTPRQSSIESTTLIGVAFATNLGLIALILPWFGVELPFMSNFKITLIFVVIGLLRAYAVRRFFNWLWG